MCVTYLCFVENMEKKHVNMLMFDMGWTLCFCQRLFPRIKVDVGLGPAHTTSERKLLLFPSLFLIFSSLFFLSFRSIPIPYPFPPPFPCPWLPLALFYSSPSVPPPRSGRHIQLRSLLQAPQRCSGRSQGCNGILCPRNVSDVFIDGEKEEPYGHSQNSPVLKAIH